MLECEQLCMVLFLTTHVTLSWSLIAWIPPSALLPIPENNCHQISGRLLQTFQLVWWMYVHQMHWLLCGLSIHKLKPHFITGYLYYVIHSSFWTFANPLPSHVQELFSISIPTLFAEGKQRLLSRWPLYVSQIFLLIWPW